MRTIEDLGLVPYQQYYYDVWDRCIELSYTTIKMSPSLYHPLDVTSALIWIPCLPSQPLKIRSVIQDQKSEYIVWKSNFFQSINSDTARRIFRATHRRSDDLPVWGTFLSCSISFLPLPTSLPSFSLSHLLLGSYTLLEQFQSLWSLVLSWRMHFSRLNSVGGKLLLDKSLPFFAF